MGELKKKLNTIKGLKGVRNAYIEEDALIVEIQEWGDIVFVYPSEFDISIDFKTKTGYCSETGVADILDNSQMGGTYYSVCLADKICSDENYSQQAFSITANSIVQEFNSIGIRCVTEAPTLDWFKSQMFNYDTIILLTHGRYINGLHWLDTATEFEFEMDGEYPKLPDVVKQHYGFDKYCITPFFYEEVRNGAKQTIGYVGISEVFISSIAGKGFSLNSPHIFFNCACCSVEKNNEMANAFINQGINFYFGYDGKNAVAPKAMYSFFSYMLSGESAKGASDMMGYKYDQKYKSNIHFISDGVADASNTYIVRPHIPSNILNALGPYMTITRGNKPPIIEGVYYVNPIVIRHDNGGNNMPGDSIPSAFIRFYDQNTKDNTISFSFVNTNGLVSVDGNGNIGGTGNKFSAYFDCVGKGTGFAIDEYQINYSFTTSFQSGWLLSGDIVDGSIQDLQYGFLVTNKTEEPENAYIHIVDVGTAWVAFDGDGLSPYYSFPSTTSYAPSF